MEISKEESMYLESEFLCECEDCRELDNMIEADIEFWIEEKKKESAL